MIRNQDGQPPATYKVHPWGSEGAIRYGLRYLAGWLYGDFLAIEMALNPQITTSMLNLKVMWSLKLFSHGKLDVKIQLLWSPQMLLVAHDYTFESYRSLLFVFFFKNFPKCSRHQNILDRNFEACEYFKHVHGSHDYHGVLYPHDVELTTYTHPSSPITSQHVFSPKNEVATSPFRAT